MLSRNKSFDHHIALQGCILAPSLWRFTHCKACWTIVLSDHGSWSLFFLAALVRGIDCITHCKSTEGWMTIPFSNSALDGPFRAASFSTIPGKRTARTIAPLARFLESFALISFGSIISPNRGRTISISFPQRSNWPRNVRALAKTANTESRHSLSFLSKSLILDIMKTRVRRRKRSVKRFVMRSHPSSF